MKNTIEAKMLSIHKTKERIDRNRAYLNKKDISEDLREHIAHEIKEDVALLAALKLELADEIVEAVERQMVQSHGKVYPMRSRRSRK